MTQLVVVLLLAACTAALPVQKTFKTRELFGHRGNPVEYPENTLVSFLGCTGCEVVELDIHLSTDNIPFAMHDSTIDRTTNGTGRTESFSMDELKALDAGYRFTPDNGATYPYRGKGVTVPTLEEILSQVPNVKLNIDIKTHTTRAAEEVANVIRRSGQESRMIVGSFDGATFEAFQALMPTVTTLGSVEEIANFTVKYYAGRAAEHEPQAEYYEVPVGYVRDVADYILAANGIGVKVVFWTINNEALMRELLDAGADGIITDEVRLAASVFEDYDVRRPT